MSYDTIREKRPRLVECRRYSVYDLNKSVAASRCGATVKDLSIKYNIPPSTIHYHKAKPNAKAGERGNYSTSDLGKALQDCATGIPVIHSSMKYNIPQSTIYKYIKKNIEKKSSEDVDVMAKARELHDDAVLKTRPTGLRNYSASDLDKAIEACKAGSTYLEASRKYNIPRTTIHDRCMKLAKFK